MAMTRILILTTIVAAFVLFGIVLAWGEYQTRHLVRDRKQGREKDGLSNTPKPVFRVKFNQAAKAVEAISPKRLDWRASRLRARG